MIRKIFRPVFRQMIDTFILLLCPLTFYIYTKCLIIGEILWDIFKYLSKN